jgi:hypothetical protein
MIPVLICTVYLLQYQFMYLWFAVAGNSTDSQEIQVQQRSGICLVLNWTSYKKVDVIILYW